MTVILAADTILSQLSGYLSLAGQFCVPYGCSNSSTLPVSGKRSKVSSLCWRLEIFIKPSYVFVGCLMVGLFLDCSMVSRMFAAAGYFKGIVEFVAMFF